MCANPPGIWDTASNPQETVGNLLPQVSNTVTAGWAASQLTPGPQDPNVQLGRLEKCE